jgi:ATP-dependent Clp protease ATP-binding subunit ClpC
MFNFNLRKAAIFQAVRWEGFVIFRFSRALKKIFFTLFTFTFLGFLYGFLLEKFSLALNTRLFGLTLIFLFLAILNLFKESFLNSRLKNPRMTVTIETALKEPEKYNLAGFLNFEVARAVWRAIRFARSKRFPEVNSSMLFYFLLKENHELDFIFSRTLINKKEVMKILESHFRILKSKKFSKNYSEDFQKTILGSLKTAQKEGKERIEEGDVLIALSQYDLILKKILIDADLRTKDVENLVWWLESLKKKIREREKWWEYKNLIKRGSLGKEWAAGYTITLDRFSRDWSESIRIKNFPEVIGHEKEISRVERILASPETNNVLLVGEPGTGRKSILQSITTKSFLGQSLPEINYKIVKEVDLSALFAQIENKERVEAILDNIFQEATTAGNIILVIDEFHNFVETKDRPGVVDISGILTPYLRLPQFQLIAISSFVGLHRSIEQNPSLLSLFEKVEVLDISERETLMLLENLAQGLEKKYNKFVTYPALRDIINYTKRYLPNLPFPEKAIDLFNEAMIYLVTTKDKILMPEHISRIFSEKIQIPVGKMEVKEKKILLNLEKLIHKRIINQDKAVNEVSSALRRARAEVTIRKGPIGCFLFLGPTGVGKTETSKALTEIYFGSESKMIRLDMSEFQSTKDIPRLIGSPGEEGLLTTQARENPFSSILLDEIEKAHPNILNLFLQVLDEGFLTDGLGRKVDFKNSIIVATSNAGYKVILKALKEKTKWGEVKQKLLDYLFEKAIFRPEFINRFDAVIVFRPLSHENLLDIAELMLQKLKKNLKEKGIDFIITEALKEKIVKLGYSPIFGAREMRRVIQDKIENVIATALLSGKLKRGHGVEIIPENFELMIK